MAPLKKLFKHHIHLPLNASDNIIYNSLFPSINNLFDILVKSQLNTLSALFNTPVLREIAIQKIYNLQNELWLPNIPTDITPFVQSCNNHSYLVKSLSLINQYRFNLDITFDSKTIGGTTPIREYLPDLSLNDINSLKKKRIMFMDQLVSPDGNYLLTWSEVKIYNQNNYKGPKPKWFKNLEDNYTLSDMRRLTYPLKDPVCSVERYHKHPKIKAGVSQPRQEWTIHWNNNVKNAIIGKTLLQESATSYSITYSEHYIPYNNNIPDNSQISSPRNTPLILIRCNGCSLHSYFPHDLRPKCVITTRTKNLSLFNIYKKSSPEHKKFANIITSPYFIATKTLFSLKHQVFQLFLKLNNINVPHTLNTDSPALNNHDLKHTYNIIHTALICSLPVKDTLFSLAKNFINHTNFIFYTDGSVKNLGTPECKSGYGWIQAHPNTPRKTFKGSTLFFPSSTKSESMAIMTALITIPKNSICTIITDSANCVRTLQDRLKNPTLSPRKRLKLNNFLIWDLIIWLIEYNNLTVHIEKIKAHSGNLYNDQADSLAKAGAECPQPIIVNFKFFNKSSIGFFNWNHMYIVDRNIRSFANTPIQSTLFNSVVSNSSLTPINDHIINGSIDWYFTKLWINHNHYDSPTCEKLSRKQGSKIKKANFLYPTLDILQRNYPKLYPNNSLPCTSCQTYTDSNLHIALCRHHRPILDNILQKHKEKLYTLLEHNSTTFTFDLKSRLDASSLFEVTLHDLSSDSLPLLQPNLLLIYNLIPIELTCFFYNYIGNQKTRNKIFLLFVTDLIQDINYHIWRGHRNSTTQWESNLQITPKKKRNYRKQEQYNSMHTHNHVSTTSSNTAQNAQHLLSRSRKRRRNIAHEPLLITPTLHNGEIYRRPYYKLHSRIDQSQHIRWTSSNFLHSGSWELHRDTILFNDNIDLFSFTAFSNISHLLPHR